MNRLGITWAQLHGASTHFPVVLSLVAFACDLAAVWRWQHSDGAGLRRAALGAVLLAAVGSLVAATTGLVLAHGEFWGDGDLGAHHRFVWPAFGLIVGAAVWRSIMHAHATRRDLAIYVGAVAGIGALFLGGSYFGGEMLLSAA